MRETESKRKERETETKRDKDRRERQSDEKRKKERTKEKARSRELVLAAHTSIQVLPPTLVLLPLFLSPSGNGISLAIGQRTAVRPSPPSGRETDPNLGPVSGQISSGHK